MNVAFDYNETNKTVIKTQPHPMQNIRPAPEALQKDKHEPKSNLAKTPRSKLSFRKLNNR